MIGLPDRLALKLVTGIGCILLLALLVHDRNRWKAKTTHYAELLAGERAAHQATVANYRLAAERARQADADNIARVKDAQAKISERSTNDFESRIAIARAAAERLRGNQAAAGHPGSGGAAAVPALPTAAQGAAQAAGQDRLPYTDRLIATEQAIQLDELIKWVERQHAIDRD